MDYLRILTVESSHKAALVQNQLDLTGIFNFKTNEHFSNLMPHYHGILGSGIQIMIRANDLPTNKTMCPNCKSLDFKVKNFTNYFTNLLTIFFSILIFNPFGNIRKPLVCNICGAEF